MRQSIVNGIVVGLLLAGCSTTAFEPSAAVTTLAPGADQWFRLSFEPMSDKDSQHVRLRGYVHNTYGEAVGRVQLLAQSLDSGGSVVDEKVVSVPGAVPAFNRVYCEIPTMLRADRYRVTVWAYERRKFF